jgi:hypothetical protein
MRIELKCWIRIEINPDAQPCFKSRIPIPGIFRVISFCYSKYERFLFLYYRYGTYCKFFRMWVWHAAFKKLCQRRKHYRYILEIGTYYVAVLLCRFMQKSFSTKVSYLQSFPNFDWFTSFRIQIGICNAKFESEP